VGRNAAHFFLWAAPRMDAGACSGLARSFPLYLCFLFALLALFMFLLAGSGPAASNFLLLRQKKVTKEKATRSLGPLRFAPGQPAVLEPSGGSLNSLRFTALRQRDP